MAHLPNDETALSFAARLRRLISASGPISLAQYMAESNAHYYASRDPLGVDGDFVTAPEISQMFGEMVGLWLADMWHRAGSPRPVHYVELGPGRGTLARDAVRAMRTAGLLPKVHLVEASPGLRTVQAAMLDEAVFHDSLSTLPTDGALLAVANEFLDALPVRQLVMTSAGWRETHVGLEGDSFVQVADRTPMDAAIPQDLREVEEGTVLETSPAAAAVVSELAQLLVAQGGAGLLIDYGSAASRYGSTLQAVRDHAKVDPFSAPGDMDLTAHVDFMQLADIARSHECRCLGIAEQGPWLRALGIDQRAAALSRAAPDRGEEIAVALERLTGDTQMGTLFKVMGLAAPTWPAGVGFA